MRTHFRNATVIDASGAPAYRGTVTVDGERITAVSHVDADLPAAPGDTFVDCEGLTILPGLTEAHCHISFNNLTSMYQAVEIQPEDHSLLALSNAQMLLERGFTSLFSAASAKPRVDVAVRDAINNGLFFGPRMRAAGQEISPSGNLGDLDNNYLTFPRNVRFTVTCDGADEFTRAARLAARDGVDTIKVNVSGDRDWGHMHADDTVTVIAERELARGDGSCQRPAADGCHPLHQLPGRQDVRSSGCASHLSCAACRRGSPRHAGGREGSHLRGARRRVADQHAAPSPGL